MHRIVRPATPRASLCSATALALAICAAPPSASAATPHPLHAFASVTISPDGARVAAIESDEAVVDGASVRQHLILRDVRGGRVREVALPCAPSTDCVPSEPTWSPDGKKLVFVLKAPKSKHRALYSASPTASGDAAIVPKRVLDFVGTLEDPRFSPHGDLAVLATAGARKEIGATQAGAPIVGEIGAVADEQRIALVRPSGTLAFASPPNLFVYEYDWRPDGRGFVGTAAPGNGDNNWWVAKLYTFAIVSGAARVVFAPPSPQLQLADPRVSPDGRYVAFIGGIMSDFGSTGGDVYLVALASSEGTATATRRKEDALDLTADARFSATSLAWDCRSATLRFSALQGSDTTIRAFAPDAIETASKGASERELWRAPQTISSRDAAFSQACATDTSAVVRQDYEHPPEIAIGAVGAWNDLTHANAAVLAATEARSITWKSDGYDVAGWLLAPRRLDASKKYPLIVDVHGGPSAASTPRFVGRGVVRDLLLAGDFIFFPNPRGSFGQGEAFARANVRDFGYGDLRDDLAGIDAAENVAPVDDARLGITGGSYGGFMTMWAVTQTQRFKAGVAGAGLSDWISYYGQNGIDEWMIPFFGASAYDDPAAYRKSSPI